MSSHLPVKSSEVTVLPSASVSTSGCSSAIRFSAAEPVKLPPSTSASSRANEQSLISAKHRGGAAQHRARVSLPAGDADPVQVFEHLDRQIAADPGTVLELSRSEMAFGRSLGQFARNPGEPLDRFGQKEAVRCDLRDPAETLDTLQKADQRLGLQ